MLGEERKSGEGWKRRRAYLNLGDLNRRKIP
jgi:hypothetical protein